MTTRTFSLIDLDFDCLERPKHLIRDAIPDRIERIEVVVEHGAALGFGRHQCARMRDAMQRHAIAINASFFNTHRQMEQYVTKGYFTL